MEYLNLALIFALLIFLWWSWPRRKKIFQPATKGSLSMTKQLDVGGTTTGTVSYQDKSGATVPIVGVPTWTVDNSSVATVSPAADGMSATVTGVAVGTATITVVAEGDPTPGVDTITLTGGIAVVDEAATGTLTFS